MNKYCVTINRQFGSMGRTIAREVSQSLEIEYYDRDIVEATSKKLDLPISTVCNNEETDSKPSFFDRMFPLGDSSQETRNKIFNVQRQIILDLADKESCIIVGRCADFILKDYKNCLNIFIYAPKDYRFNNCVNILNMEPSQAERMMAEVDKARDHYYKYYAGYSHEDYRHKHIMIDSSVLGVKGTANLLVDMIKSRFQL